MFTENITSEAYQKLLDLDRTFVNTKDYMGVAYFWSHAYKHSLRDASQEQRQATHEAFRKAGLELAGESAAHDKIIREMFGNNAI